jgi:hypothetical protein
MTAAEIKTEGVSYAIWMRETHRRDRPWVFTPWARNAKDRAGAIRLLGLAREMNADSPYKPQFRLLELRTTVVEVTEP